MKKLLYSALFACMSLSPCSILNAQSMDNATTVVNINGIKAEVLSKKIYVRYKSIKPEKASNSILGVNSKLISTPLFPENFSIRNKKSNTVLSAKEQDITEREKPLLRTFIIEFNENISPDKFCKQIMQSDPSIEIAEPYYVYHTLGSTNDPLLSQQTMLKTLKILDAWDSVDFDKKIIVGVCDNGMYQDHPDLTNSIATNEGEIPDDGIDNDGNGYIDDYRGINLTNPEDKTGWGRTASQDSHGSQVAGIIGATSNNSIGISGIINKFKIFPIKAAPFNNPGNLYCGYQGIIYAAQRGFDVINCSWGTVKSPSQTEQAVIDYAVSKGLIIVCAGGNIKGSFDRYDRFYPASYHGVLSVGEVDQKDKVTLDNTSLSSSVRIMAPGTGNYSTDNLTGYETLGLGTSYASPVVSGLAALVKAKYPELTPLQIIEYMRQQTDDITYKNFSNTELIPGRVNALKCVSGQPFSAPGIRLLETRFFDTEGNLTDRFSKGDTATVELVLKNELGPAKNLRFSLSVGYQFMADNIIVLDSIYTKPTLAQGEEFTVKGFKFTITNDYSDGMIFRTDITADNNYKDFFKFDFFPGVQISTFANDTMQFSADDNGCFGYTNDLQLGVGMEVFSVGNFLYQGGLLASVNNTIAFSTNWGASSNNNDFTPEKLLIAPDRNIGIVTSTKQDEDGQPKTIKITTKYTFPDDKLPVIRKDLTIQNLSTMPLTDVAIGYCFDWDIYFSKKNKTAYFELAIPADMKSSNNIAAQYAYCPDSSTYIGSLAYSKQSSAIGQASGNNGDLDIESNLIKAITSGNTIQNTETTDINYAVGIKFPGSLGIGAERTCTVCTGYGKTPEQLAYNLIYCMDKNWVGVNEETESGLQITPNPVHDIFAVSLPESEQVLKVEILDMLGNIVLHQPNSTFALNKAYFNASGLADGVYICRLICDNCTKTIKLIVAK